MTREKKEWCVDAIRLGQELSLGPELSLALACVDALRLDQQLSLMPPLSRPHNDSQRAALFSGHLLGFQRLLYSEV
jgi:hypothetical protein